MARIAAIAKKTRIGILEIKAQATVKGKHEFSPEIQNFKFLIQKFEFVNPND